MDSSLSNFRLERKVSTFAHTLLSFVDCNWNNSCVDYCASSEGSSLAGARAFACTRVTVNVKPAARNLIIRAHPGLLKHIFLFISGKSFHSYWLNLRHFMYVSKALYVFSRKSTATWMSICNSSPPPRWISEKSIFSKRAQKIGSNNPQLAFFFLEEDVDCNSVGMVIWKISRPVTEISLTE